MAQKTLPTDADVEAFLAAVPDERRREDARAVCRILAEETGEAPAMWGASMVGFGIRRLRSASGREGDWPVVAFAPRKAALTLYSLLDQTAEHDELLARLGPHTTGKGCLYVKRLADVDEGVLRALVRRAQAAPAS